MGINQSELARRLGVSRSTVCGWEAGNRTPTLEQAAKLATALGCTVDTLIGAQTAADQAETEPPTG